MFSLRSWRYCVGARLKFWRRSRVPKKRSSPPSNLTRLYYNGSAAKSHSTTTQYRQLRRLNNVGTCCVRQTNATLLANNSQYCLVLHIASFCTPCCMLLSKVGNRSKFSCVQTDATTPINVGSCWSTMFRPFAWGFRHKTIQNKAP